MTCEDSQQKTLATATSANNTSPLRSCNVSSRRYTVLWAMLFILCTDTAEAARCWDMLGATDQTTCIRTCRMPVQILPDPNTKKTGQHRQPQQPLQAVDRKMLQNAEPKAMANAGFCPLPRCARLPETAPASDAPGRSCRRLCELWFKKSIGMGNACSHELQTGNCESRPDAHS